MAACALSDTHAVVVFRRNALNAGSWRKKLVVPTAEEVAGVAAGRGEL